MQKKKAEKEEWAVAVRTTYEKIRNYQSSWKHYMELCLVGKEPS